jgi:phage baseplate assembly protein W
MPQVPHFALPLRLDAAGRLAVLEQDSADEIAQCVAVVMATPEGSRIEVPEFGVPRYEFRTPNAADIIAAVTEWEPRADLDIDVVQGLGDDASITVLHAAVRPHVSGEDAL